MDSIVHGILQARILEWIAFPFSRGSSQLRDRTQVSCMKQINGLNMFMCNRGEWSEGRAIINGEGNSKEHRPSEGGRKEKANSPGRGQSVQRPWVRTLGTAELPDTSKLK